MPLIYFHAKMIGKFNLASNLILFAAFQVILHCSDSCDCQGVSGATGQQVMLWDYSLENGPNSWCSSEPHCCGKRQSPINIVTQLARDRSHELGAVNLDRFVTGAVGIMVTVDGRTLIFRRERSDEDEEGGAAPTVTVSGGCLGHAEYVMETFHFHWGHLDKHGSDHTINGHAYPLELHVVNRNVLYSSLDEAMNFTDGVAVIAVHIRLNSNGPEGYNDAAYKELSGFLANPGLSDGLPHVFALESGLRALLPENAEEFYCYAGSLTTPHCNEVVTWTVMKEPVVIARDFIDQLRLVPANSNDATPIIDNFRPVQPLHGRTVSVRLHEAKNV